MDPNRWDYLMEEDSSSDISDDTIVHYDLLCFISIGFEFGLELMNVSPWPALGALGAGATSAVEQAQISADMHLAFKRSAWEDISDLGSQQQYSNRFKVLITEVLALELLRHHPNVVRLVGISWEVDRDNETWPMFLMERSNIGTLATFIRTEKWKSLPTSVKFRLCADVADAISEAHKSGILHCDIKCENVLLFEDTDRLVAKVIDFGYTSFGTSAETLCQVAPGTIPWQAPERGLHQYTILEGVKMDIYSFGMLVCRTLLWQDLPLSIGAVGQMGSHEEEQKLAGDIDQSKMSDNFLESVLNALDRTQVMDSSYKENLRGIFKQTLANAPEDRAECMEDILEFFVAEAIEIPAYEPDPSYRPLDYMHRIFCIEEMLADLDECGDYIMHERIVANLQDRVRSNNCDCYTQAAYQLGICYSIGFGIERNQEEAENWIQKARKIEPDLPTLSDQWEFIRQSYCIKPPERLDSLLGHQFTWRPVNPESYITQDRSFEVLQYLQRQIRDREESLGKNSRPVISLMAKVANLLLTLDYPQGAISMARDAYHAAKRALGPRDYSTRGVEAVYLSALIRAGGNDEVESLLLSLIHSEESSSDLDLSRMVNLRQALARIFLQQGRYNEALPIIRSVIPTQKQLRGEGHPETLVTRRSECQALTGLGELGEAEDLQRSVLRDTLRTRGPEELLTWVQQEQLAEILLRQGKLDEAEELAFCAMTESELGRGLEDAFTLRATSTWACVRAAHGKFDEPLPETVMEDVVERWIARSGGPNPEIIEEMIRTAIVYSQAGNMEKSMQWRVRALKDCHQGFVPYQAKLSKYKERLENLSKL